MQPPVVELLWWEGCPSTEEALNLLRGAMSELGLDPSTIRVTEIQTDDEARSAGFVGSPTILVDGADVQPPDPDDEIGLTCRIYRSRDGRVSPLPDPEDLKAALSR